MSTFVPKDPETLVGFDNVLAEFNEINGINTVFTDDYMVRWDIYVGTETTADGYEVYTIQHEGDNQYVGENIFMYKPDAYEIINSINNGDYFDKCVVYIEELEDYVEDLEYYMLEELNTNFINYLDENKLKD